MEVLLLDDSSKLAMFYGDLFSFSKLFWFIKDNCLTKLVVCFERGGIKGVSIF